VHTAQAELLDEELLKGLGHGWFSLLLGAYQGWVFRGWP
jgi:hypothetical protein